MKKLILLLIIISPFITKAQNYKLKQEFYAGANYHNFGLPDSLYDDNLTKREAAMGFNLGTNFFFRSHKIFNFGLGLAFTTNNYIEIINLYVNNIYRKDLFGYIETPIIFNFSYTFKNGLSPFFRTSIILQHQILTKAKVLKTEPEGNIEYYEELLNRPLKFDFQAISMGWLTVSIGASKNIKDKFNLGIYTQFNFLPIPFPMYVINLNLFLQLNYKKIN